jgi:hypothetical protein
VDLILIRRGDDLFVKQDVAGRTLLKSLRVVVSGCLFVLHFALLLKAYGRFTGVHAALVQEYAKKYVPGAFEAQEAYRDGWRFDRAGDHPGGGRSGSCWLCCPAVCSMRVADCCGGRPRGTTRPTSAAPRRRFGGP